MIFISQQQLMGLLKSFNPVMLIYIFPKFIITASYRILSRMGVELVLVLEFTYKVVDYTVVRLNILYLTDKTNDVMKAVVLTNIGDALSVVLRIVAVYIAETRLGHIKVIIFSAISFTLGLALLYISTIKYSELFVIIGILLLAVGKAGLEALLESFLSHQLKFHEPETNFDESRVRTRKNVWSSVWGFVIEFFPAVVELEKKYESRPRTQKSVWTTVWIRAWLLVITFSPAVVAFLLGFFFQWKNNVLIATWMMGSACFLFCYNTHLYHPKPRELAGVGNGFSVIFSVIKAFVLQIWILGYPTSSYHPVDYDNDEDKFQLSPKINWLRGLDKVAIIESSAHSQEEQKKFGRICSASQVQLVKRFLSMIPMWTTILVVGLVVSTGDSFFPEQGYNMKSSDFIVSLFILQSLSRRMASYLLSLLIHSKWIPEAKKKTAIQVGIWGGIVSSILCSSIAWQVEQHRRALSDMNTMSIFWLSPQYFLLGLTEGLVETGLDEFTVEQFQDPWKEYACEITQFVFGLGSFLSILYIKANESLFRDSLWDVYYHRLTIVSYVNMLFFFSIIYIFYRSRYPNISGGTRCWIIPAKIFGKGIKANLIRYP